MPFTGLPSLLNFEVQSEVEPFLTTAPTMHLKRGSVAIGSMCDVVGDVRDLHAESDVKNIMGLPLAVDRTSFG